LTIEKSERPESQNEQESKNDQESRNNQEIRKDRYDRCAKKAMRIEFAP
jgi:hypothetical protein